MRPEIRTSGSADDGDRASSKDWHLFVGLLMLALAIACAALQLSPPAATPRAAHSAPPSLAAQLQAAASAVVLSAVLSTCPATAIGPEQVVLDVQGYEETTCPPELAQGRAGGALGAGAGGAGIAQKCVTAKAKASNGSGKQLIDAGVFGLVNEAATSMSVLGNGQDGKNDAGQFAMIPKIPAGDSMVEFTFVSQQSDPCISTRKEKCPVEGTLPLVGLKFEKVKAIAYPGGDRYKLYDECEQNEFAEGC